MATEQHPGNNTLPTQHLATKSRYFQRWLKTALPTVTACNKPRSELSLNMDSWNFCLLKNFPEFLNLEYPLLLGCHLCRLVDSNRPFGRVRCLHLQGQEVRELVPYGLYSSIFPAVWSPTFLPTVCVRLFRHYKVTCVPFWMLRLVLYHELPFLSILFFKTIWTLLIMFQ